MDLPTASPPACIQRAAHDNPAPCPPRAARSADHRCRFELELLMEGHDDGAVDAGLSPAVQMLGRISHVLHPQAFGHSATRPGHEAWHHQPIPPAHPPQNDRDLLADAYHRNLCRLPRRNYATDPVDLNLERRLVEEENCAQSLHLGSYPHDDR